MRRSAIRICVFLLLGAIVNVAVAWGCSWWVIPGYVGVYRETVPAVWAAPTVDPSSAMVVLSDGFGVTEKIVMRDLNERMDSAMDFQLAAAAGPLSWQRFYREAFAFRDTKLGQVKDEPATHICIEAGWPSRSVRGWARPLVSWQPPPRSLKEMAGAGKSALVRLRRTERNGTFTVVIPYGVLWPGFAINSVFYAVVLWLLFAGPFVLLGRRRIRRGLCPKCAYDLRGSTGATTCPECGAVVSDR